MNKAKGLLTSYYVNGQIKRIGVWEAGKQEGEFKQYTKTGVLEKTEVWGHGVLMD